MVEQFLAQECTSRQHPLRCMVQSGDVKNGSALMKTYDGKTVDNHAKIANIEWTDGTSMKPLVMLAGQHRVAAATQAWPKLRDYKRELDGKAEDLRVQFEKAAHGSDKSEEIKAARIQMDADIHRYRAYMDLVQRWPVEVYDEGK